MPRARNQSLGGRADQAGVLFAATNAPLTFQRTLMPRATMDQALVTGLSASTNHALVTLMQETHPVRRVGARRAGRSRHGR